MTPLYVKKNQINCLILKVKIATISILFQTTDILSITKLWQFHRYANISQHFQGPKSADLLEVYAIFWFEDILVSQKIYAIVENSTAY